MWEWVLRSRIFDSWPRGTGISPNFPYFCICGSSGLASVMVRPWKAGNYLRMGNWSVFVLLEWRFVFGIIMKREARAHIVRCHHHSGNNIAASLLRLLRFIVSNRHGLVKSAHLQGDISAQSLYINRSTHTCLLYTSPSPRDS